MIRRTISAMVGKGSVNHNSRKFKAANVDGERTHLNIDYCNEPIKQVYHELFDEALKKYNAKQTRSDRRIEGYYEKIRSSKQEKPFHELILQFEYCDHALLLRIVGDDQIDTLVHQAKELRQTTPKHKSRGTAR